jgi:hypothetical protein
LVRVWGSAAAVEAGLAVYPQLTAAVAAYIGQRRAGYTGVTRLLLPFVIAPNPYLEEGGDNSFLAAMFDSEARQRGQ